MEYPGHPKNPGGRHTEVRNWRRPSGEVTPDTELTDRGRKIPILGLVSTDEVDPIKIKVKIQNEILRVKKTKEKIFIGKKGVSISCHRTVQI